MFFKHHAPAALAARKKTRTYCTEGWMGLRAGLKECEKPHLHRGSSPEPLSPQRVIVTLIIPCYGIK